ncbi:MAG: exo-alpha-sialidase [Bryobacteraceae bacterium]
MLTRRQFVLAAALAPDASAAAPELWTPRAPVPESGALEDVADVSFHIIKAHEPEADGYSFLHGVGLCWHKGMLYASFGHNKGKENTSGEESRGRFSRDGGRTWSGVFTIDDGAESPDLAVSHGVFLSHAGRLWAFMGAFHGERQRVHTRAYFLDERRNSWTFRGVALDGGFWPMQQPIQLADGNWIMAGLHVGDDNPAAVAISHGADFTKWRQVVIPQAPGLGRMWGESTVIVYSEESRGDRVLNIARYGDQPMALVAESRDHGRTWTPSTVSNLPMVTSKPYAGTLSNGFHYLIATTTADSARRRSPLTIALSPPGEPRFRRILRIRDSVTAAPLVDSNPGAALSYPYALEHEEHLYVGYSNNGGRVGQNINSAELAVIPIAALR